MGLRKERGPYICMGCNKEYHTRRPPGEGEKYCSRKCSFDNSGNSKYWGLYSKITQPKYTSIKPFICIDCGDKSYIRTTSSKKYCISCDWKHQKINRLEPRECRHCSIPFTPLTGSNMGDDCSDECREKANLKNRRASKALRRARIRQSMKEGGEQFDPIDVLERDRWVCQACGCDTPKTLRGTIDDNAPQLDHIAPLAKGGEHTMANTQCLCRVCNILKSDKTMVKFMNECSSSIIGHGSVFKRVQGTKPMYIQHNSNKIPLTW